MMVRVRRYAKKYGRRELMRLRIIGISLLVVWVLWRWIGGSSSTTTLTGHTSTTNSSSSSSSHSISSSISSISISSISTPFKCEDIILPSISKKKLCKISIDPSKDEDLPEYLCEAYPNLSILFLSNNIFKQIPTFINRCSKLQMISFKSNKITHIPSLFPPHLRWLILTDNQITDLPPTFGTNLPALQKLMLSGNKLTTLPTSIAACTNLELIRLASNRLAQPPPLHLLRLPNLAWIALSGNPFLQGVADKNNHNNNNNNNNNTLTVIDDPVLETGGTVLGEGTSGITRKVRWKPKQRRGVNDNIHDNTDDPDTTEQYHQQQEILVAVKTYKSNTITSDGTPLEERRINVAIASIQHDSLVRVYGQTPNGSLVMEFLDGYTPFGQPPSYDSCTRDVYPDHQTIRPEHAKIMTANLLEVLTQLHQRGIAHGDLYGHNILVNYDYKGNNNNNNHNNNFSVKLSDFGASFFYDKDAPYGKYIQRIEMRAFGHLVEEIDTLLGRTEAGHPLRKALQKLAHACLRRSDDNGDGDDNAATTITTFRHLDNYYAGLF